MLTGPQFSADAAAANLRKTLAETRTRIASAALRCGRDPASVGLLAITKGQPAQVVRAAAELGQLDFGENYLQEAMPKLGALADLPLTWHYTGQIQSNKTRPIAERFAWVHTVDRERIAVRLSEQRPHHAPALNICVQVRLADEPGKAGVAPNDVPDLMQRVSVLPRLKLRGLMCLPPPMKTFEEQHACFRQLADCLAQLNTQGYALDTLSMGMSSDLEAAIAAGATWVRIGTAIFGERPPA
jgi:pyridoxal phosphate enzyme (YggS family)